MSGRLGAIRRAWCEHPALFAAFVLSVGLTLFFALRIVVFTLYWANPAHRDRPMEAWMTPRYVARSWQVPPEVVSAALDLPPAPRRVTLGEIARSRGQTVEELARRLEAAIIAWRAAHREPQGRPDAAVNDGAGGGNSP